MLLLKRPASFLSEGLGSAVFPVFRPTPAHTMTASIKRNGRLITGVNKGLTYFRGQRERCVWLPVKLSGLVSVRHLLKKPQVVAAVPGLLCRAGHRGAEADSTLLKPDHSQLPSHTRGVSGGVELQREGPWPGGSRG